MRRITTNDHEPDPGSRSPVTTPIGRPAWERTYARVLVGTDLAALLTAAAITALAGIVPTDGSLWADGEHVDDPLVFVALAAIWTASLAVFGAYEAKTVGIGSEEYKRLGRGALSAVATTTFLAFTFAVGLNRAFLFVAFPLATALAGVLRQVERKGLHRLRASGRYTRRVLVAGTRDTVTELVSHFRRAPFAGFTVVAACVPGEGPLIVDDEEVPIAGGPDAVVTALDQFGADTLAVADSGTFPGSALRRLSWELEGTGIDLIVAPAVTEIAGPRIVVRPVAGIPLLHVEEPSLSGSARFAKGVFDRAFAMVGFLLLAPVVIVLALVVRLTSRGPVLFRQTRVGRDGREFRMLKFRTMVDGAEDRLAEVRVHAAPDQVLFKLPDDPRVTPIGRWLRRHSLDELPQLWNVIVGQMSVVGPRPPLPSEVAEYADETHRRLIVKPGMTGLWQVSGRADLSWDDAVRLDLYYVENWSWVLDALILVRTIPAIVKGRGAY